MIPADLFKDELHKYFMERRLTESDGLFLSTWGVDVAKQLQRQNQVMLETMDILESHKSICRNIEKERGTSWIDTYEVCGQSHVFRLCGNSIDSSFTCLYCL